MSDSKLEYNVTLIQQVGKNKSLLIPLFVSENKCVDIEQNQVQEAVWLPELLNLSVNSLNRFVDDEWDYNSDVLHPPRSVQGAKLKIDFSKYSSIPKYVMIVVVE